MCTLHLCRVYVYVIYCSIAIRSVNTQQCLLNYNIDFASSRPKENSSVEVNVLIKSQRAIIPYRNGGARSSRPAPTYGLSGTISRPPAHGSTAEETRQISNRKLVRSVAAIVDAVYQFTDRRVVTKFIPVRLRGTGKRSKQRISVSPRHTGRKRHRRKRWKWNFDTARGASANTAVPRTKIHRRRDTTPTFIGQTFNYARASFTGIDFPLTLSVAARHTS